MWLTIFVCLYLLPGVGSSALRRFHRQHWESMAGKNTRKHHQPSGDTQETSEVVVEERSFLEVFISNQARRDEEMIDRMEGARKEQLAADERARKEQLAAEDRAEKRRLKAEIAAEEREEKRRERAKIAEEERIEARAIAKDKRKREEAMRQEEQMKEKEELARQAAERAAVLKEEANKEREELARQAAERAARLQEEANKEREEMARQTADKAAEMQAEVNRKAFEQQRELMRLQADLGKKASEAHRVESEKSKLRDRTLSSLPSYQKGEDVEEFLLATERKLTVGEIPEGDWLPIIASKLNGEVGASWQELCMGEGEYRAVKATLLKACGYTPEAAGEAYYAFRGEHLKGLAADQVYKRGALMVKRMVAPMVMGKEMLFRLVKPWVYACVGRKARAVLKNRAANDADSLVEGLQDYLSEFGDNVSGKKAVFGEVPSFRKPAYSTDYDKERRKPGVAGGSSSSSMKCFRCGKVGHKIADCWQGEKGGAGSKPVESGSNLKIVCYICGVEGHKATTCPGKKEAQKGASVKPVRQLTLSKTRDTILQGKVNGQGASLLLDSGAHITVVPEDMVGEELKTGESVVVRAFHSETPMKLPIAKVKFQVEGMEEWEETVALAPIEKGKETEVLYGLKLRSPRGLDLVILANKLGKVEVDVNRVTTRAEAKKEKAEMEEDARVVELEKPKVKTVKTSGKVEVNVKPSSVRADVVHSEKSTGEGELSADRPGSNPKPVTLPEPVAQAEATADGPAKVDEVSSEKGTGEGELAADRPVSDPKPVPQVAEEEVDLQEEVGYCLRQGGGLEDLGVPPVRRGPGDRAELVEEVKRDPTLQGYRDLAEKGEQGFLWERGLLYQAKVIEEEVVHVMVLPKKFRGRVLSMAHEGSSHLGARKVKALLKQRFVWPGMGVDAISHTRSCEVCQRCAKAKSRKAPLMERQIMSEPFEVLAFDLVGPFPKAKNGYMYVLTAICMGSKWPEAIPLKAQTARAVAGGMVEIFARTGIPLQLLSDQGSQFLGSLVRHLCKDLRIDQIKTAPYHPECNGVVERMHGTLVPMLTKASQLGLDWVEQLPFALFALRSAPNRDTAFSPY